MVVAGKRQWINAITNSNTITNSEKSRVLVADNAPAYKIALSWSNIQPHHAEISTTSLYFCFVHRKAKGLNFDRDLHHHDHHDHHHDHHDRHRDHDDCHHDQHQDDDHDPQMPPRLST